MKKILAALALATAVAFTPFAAEAHYTGYHHRHGYHHGYHHYHHHYHR